MTDKLLNALKERGIFNNITSLKNLKDLKYKRVYIGFDPTADSLHLGNYIQILCLQLFVEHGFEAVAVIGGATGAIGDPSGKSKERILLDQKTLMSNVKAIKKQLAKFKILVLNNFNFYNKMNVLDFLRDVGKNINVSVMLSRDMVKKRLETGLSFTEFSYQIIQGWDFKELYEKYNVDVQVGGSDQWGNIVNGVEMIRKFYQNSKVVGITVKLLTKSDGTKFGKSESGPIWLDPKKTSAFALYQFCLNQRDSDMRNLLLRLTLVSIEEIDMVMDKHKKDPYRRIAQKFLAQNLVSKLHSDEDFHSSMKLTEWLFNNKNQLFINNQDIKMLIQSIPTITYKSIRLVDALIELKIVDSKRKARELIKSQAIRINGNVITDNDFVVTKDPAFLSGKISIIKKGKRHNFVVNHAGTFNIF